MDDKKTEVIDVHDILVPPQGEPDLAGEIRHFCDMLNRQIENPAIAPQNTVLFGASKGHLIRLHAALQVAIEALETLGVLKAAN
jgi:hypothetical protein